MSSYEVEERYPEILNNKLLGCHDRESKQASSIGGPMLPSTRPAFSQFHTFPRIIVLLALGTPEVDDTSTLGVIVQGCMQLCLVLHHFFLAMMHHLILYSIYSETADRA